MILTCGCRLTRPDVLVPVSTCAKFCADFSSQHWKAVKQTFKYLKGTQDVGLELKAMRLHDQRKQLKLSAWVDADYASNLDSRASRVGYFIYLEQCPVAFGSKLQRGVPASSTGEAEYRALSIAVKELIWVKMILETLGFEVEEPMKVYEDNQCALKVVKRPGAQKRTKHVDVRHHYIRHLGEAGCIKVVYVSTKKQREDMLTKNLPRLQLTKWVQAPF